MKRILGVVFILMLNSVNADVTADRQLEINHLLGFVKNSACKITRNGKIYDGSSAMAHIQKKYHYFKDNMETTEQFIELSTTKTTVSGKYYTLKCLDSRPTGTREWLLNELENYRHMRST